MKFKEIMKFMKMSDKKGQQVNLGNLVTVIVLFAVAVLALSLITGVVQDVRDDQTALSGARNVSDNGLAGMQNLSGQFGNMGTIIAVVVIIGLLLGAFLRRPGQ